MTLCPSKTELQDWLSKLFRPFFFFFAKKAILGLNRGSSTYFFQSKSPYTKGEHEQRMMIEQPKEVAPSDTVIELVALVLLIKELKEEDINGESSLNRRMCAMQ